MQTSLQIFIPTYVIKYIQLACLILYRVQLVMMMLMLEVEDPTQEMMLTMMMIWTRNAGKSWLDSVHPETHVDC
jgi:hypothetical protein